MRSTWKAQRRRRLKLAAMATKACAAGAAAAVDADVVKAAMPRKRLPPMAKLLLTRKAKPKPAKPAMTNPKALWRVPLRRTARAVRADVAAVVDAAVAATTTLPLAQQLPPPKVQRKQ